jgi:hypothetical protein
MMTPNEFKAWFDGFTEAFEGRIPTKAQWGRIKDRVSEIDGKSVTQTVFVDRYVRSYPYYYGLQPSWQYLGNATCRAVGASNAVNLSQNTQQYSQATACNNISNQIGSGGSAFNSLQAMADLGRAEAAEVA